MVPSFSGAAPRSGSLRKTVAARARNVNRLYADQAQMELRSRTLW